MGESKKKKPHVMAQRRQRMIATRTRRVKVERMLVRGITNQQQIAAALGVSQGTISKDIAWIEENWVRRDPAESRRLRARRIKQLEAILQMAMASYDRSRANGSEGSAQFLAVAHRCVREAARLENLYPPRKRVVKRSLQAGHISITGNVNIAEVPAEVILEAKAAMERLRSHLERPAALERPAVVEAESVAAS